MMKPTFDQAVHLALGRLPFPLVESLWYVDVCSCSYDVAAASLGITADDVAGRVHSARRFIRAEVLGPTSRVGAKWLDALANCPGPSRADDW